MDDATTTSSPSEATLSVGRMTCRVLSDGTVAYDPGFLFANVDPELLRPHIQARLDVNGQLSTPYRCMLLETPSARILVDTGLGALAGVIGAPAGHLLGSLAAVGLAPDDIDVVVITHAHPDHIGGLITNGRPTFARARHVMSRVEWDFWTSPNSLASLPEMLAAPARAALPPLAAADLLDLADGDSEVVEGVRLSPAPGHTPGHCVVHLASEGASTVLLADAVVDELQYANPSWVGAVDHDAEQTFATRRRILTDAARGDDVVLAYHSPGVGRVQRRSGGFELVRDGA